MTQEAMTSPVEEWRVLRIESHRWAIARRMATHVRTAEDGCLIVVNEAEGAEPFSAWSHWEIVAEAPGRTAALAELRRLLEQRISRRTEFIPSS
jgi:hypothetical protein